MTAAPAPSLRGAPAVVASSPVGGEESGGGGAGDDGDGGHAPDGLVVAPAPSAGGPPHAPWRLRGEAVIAWCRVRRAPSDLLPAGVRRAPGLAAVVAARYQDSPVGPYDELSVAVPARIGLRPGLAVVAMVVAQSEARRGSQLNWGFPAEVGSLRWSRDGDCVRVRWEERGLEVSADPVGPPLPALLPVRAVQRRGDGPVLVPRRLWCRARLARVVADVAEDDPLAWLAGPHPGAVLAPMRLVIHPARRPTGLWSSLRAPLRAPEPALASEPLQ